MKISLNDLYYKDKIIIDEDITFDKSYYDNSEILDLKDIYVNGYIYQNSLDEYEAKLNLKGKMYLKDSNTLDKVEYEFNTDIDDIIDKNLINNQNMLEFSEFLWENIVLEVPIRYTKSDLEKVKGDNWEVKDSEDNKNLPLEKLKDLYKGGE